MTIITPEVAKQMFPGARLISVTNSDTNMETVVILGYSAQAQQAQAIHVAQARRILELLAENRRLLKMVRNREEELYGL